MALYHAEPAGPAVPRKTFVLCFDGTGNKFAGDESDSNVLKIYRMLNRGDGMTFTFYQPGIGTYVSSSHFSQTKSMYSKLKSWYLKSKDAAVGTSFAEHVMGGYTFLMRYYSSDDDLYFFGFSRGAYTARFLAEMLDHIGLLSAGNEELIKFAWKTYAKWASRRSPSNQKEHKEEEDLYNFMRGFRETFSRRVRRIRFLGLFDTVNSVPAFEGAWMQRSKFPYTARSSAKVIRHAVSIDERRAKFRQDLIAGSKRPEPRPGIASHHRYNTDLETVAKIQHFDPEKYKQSRHKPSLECIPSAAPSLAPSIDVTNVDEPNGNLDPALTRSVDHFADAPEHPISLMVGPDQLTRIPQKNPLVTASTEHLQNTSNIDEAIAAMSGSQDKARQWSGSEKTQDIQEVWFPGCHGDIGGGWARDKGEHKMISHVPLAWMVSEAEKAGLKFDPVKMAALACCPDAIDGAGNRVAHPDATDFYYGEFHKASTTGKIHDCLVLNDGLGAGGVIAWKIMEYLPFRRMDLQKDGTWKPIRWPLPCGEVRDIPHDAQIHISAINRMESNPDYRPGNLIVGGGGRGVRRAAEKYGIGQWKIYANDGDKIHQTYVRARDP